MIKENIIINGNTLEEMQKLPDNCIDLIFADPPYWMRVDGVLKRVEGTDFKGCNDEWDNQFNSLDDYERFTQAWLRECYRILKPNGSIWVIGSMQCIYSIGAIMQRIGYWLINDVIWHKKNPTPNFMGTRLNNSHETLIWATKNRKSKFTFNYKTAKELNSDTVIKNDFANGVRKQLGSVWRIPVCQGNERLKDRDGNKLHSTQKPEELLYRIIAISSKLNDLVLDPFGGTMTTGAISKRLGRNYIMIEQEKKYCEYGEERLKKEIFEDSDIAHAIFDKKPPKVTLQEMIEKKYFIENEKLYLKKQGGYVILKANGKVELPSGKITDIHTAAAIMLDRKSSRVNGFEFWYVDRAKELVSIKQVREDYRQKNCV